MSPNARALYKNVASTGHTWGCVWPNFYGVEAHFGVLQLPVVNMSYTAVVCSAICAHLLERTHTESAIVIFVMTMPCVDDVHQIYLYEYSEDLDLVERPRQVYPSAVTWFRCDMTKLSTSRQSAVARPLG